MSFIVEKIAEEIGEKAFKELSPGEIFRKQSADLVGKTIEEGLHHVPVLSQLIDAKNWVVDGLGKLEKTGVDAIHKLITEGELPRIDELKKSLGFGEDEAITSESLNKKLKDNGYNTDKYQEVNKKALSEHYDGITKNSGHYDLWKNVNKGIFENIGNKPELPNIGSSLTSIERKNIATRIQQEINEIPFTNEQRNGIKQLFKNTRGNLPKLRLNSKGKLVKSGTFAPSDANTVIKFRDSLINNGFGDLFTDGIIKNAENERLFKINGDIPTNIASDFLTKEPFEDIADEDFLKDIEGIPEPPERVPEPPGMTEPPERTPPTPSKITAEFLDSEALPLAEEGELSGMADLQKQSEDLMKDIEDIEDAPVFPKDWIMDSIVGPLEDSGFDIGQLKNMALRLETLYPDSLFGKEEAQRLLQENLDILVEKTKHLQGFSMEGADTLRVEVKELFERADKSHMEQVQKLYNESGIPFTREQTIELYGDLASDEEWVADSQSSVEEIADEEIEDAITEITTTGGTTRATTEAITETGTTGTTGTRPITFTENAKNVAQRVIDRIKKLGISMSEKTEEVLGSSIAKQVLFGSLFALGGVLLKTAIDSVKTSNINDGAKKNILEVLKPLQGPIQKITAQSSVDIQRRLMDIITKLTMAEIGKTQNTNIINSINSQSLNTGRDRADRRQLRENELNLMNLIKQIMDELSKLARDVRVSNRQQQDKEDKAKNINKAKEVKDKIEEDSIRNGTLRPSNIPLNVNIFNKQIKGDQYYKRNVKNKPATTEGNNNKYLSTSNVTVSSKPYNINY
jgi:hypothetical protein